MQPADRRWWLPALVLLVIVAVVLLLPNELRGLVLNDVVLGILVASGAAALVAGGIAAAVVLGVARLLGFSRAPPALLAAWLLRRPVDAVERRHVLAVHFGGAVLALVLVGLAFFGSAVAAGVFGPSGGSILTSGPVVGVGLLLAGGALAWGGFAYRVLPRYADDLDRPLRAVRRQSAVVGLLFAVVAGPLFAVLLFLASMAVFFR